jgi:Zinc finger, ZZ type
LINRTLAHPPKYSNDDRNRDSDSSDDEDEKEFRDTYVFDAYLLGFCDDVTRALGKLLFSSLEGEELPIDGQLLSSLVDGSDDDLTYDAKDWEDVQVPSNRVFLCPGAQAPTGSSEEIEFREIAHCDGCRARIAGTIQKCVACFDYDLCQDCFPTLSKKHYDGMHDFAAERSR